MLHATLPHHVDQVYARRERTHHARGGLVEHPIGNMIKQMTFELEVDDQINLGCLLYGCERPGVC